LTIPGGPIWASDRIDPYGTNYLNSIGPTDPHKLWVITHPAGFSGNSAISEDGTIFVAGLDTTLMALNPDGTTRWQTSLPVSPLGPLAIGPQGILYVTDSDGGLSAFSQDGNLLWTFTTEVSGKPVHGPIVAPNGTIYYFLEDMRGDTLFALLPNGQVLWTMQPGTRGADTNLRLSPDAQEIFIKNMVVNAENGLLIDLSLPTQDDPIHANKAQLFVGADGKTYLRAGHVVVQWTQTMQDFTLVQSADWNYRGAGISQTSAYPLDAGAVLKGDIWIFYSNVYSGTSIYWLDPTGKILGSFTAPFDSDARLIAIDGTNTAYICGFSNDSVQNQATKCEAYPQDGSAPIWSYTFSEDVYGVVGGAMSPGRLYIITPDGTLTALGALSNETPAPPIAP
jgi:hypothetical protein